MGTGQRRLPSFVKYLLLETPGWVLAALVALLLYERVGLSAPLIVTLLAVWVAKDLALYPLLKDALSGDAGSEADKLLGQGGVVETTLDPVGIVRLGPELWRAQSSDQGSRSRSGGACA